MEDKPVRCTKCASTQIHAEKRGWRMTTGFIGSGKVFITCLKCGNKFKPGDPLQYSALSTVEEKQQFIVTEDKERNQRVVLFFVLGGLLLLAYALSR